jgi:cytidyltransferase-like protein
MVYELTGNLPKFPQEERHYLISALRYVQRVVAVDVALESAAFPSKSELELNIWVLADADLDERKRVWCQYNSLECRVLDAPLLAGWPIEKVDSTATQSARKKIIVTGCYDWFHSGHVRFFEEVSQLGDLYVAVGHDANIKLLKGDGHPMFPQDERRYMVHSIRFVAGTFITTGRGWMDAEPEIARLKPDIYAVNEDGDVPEKRAFCAQHGLEYVILKRQPKEGLPRRESRVLRGD